MFYFNDRLSGERHLYPSELEALEAGETAIAYYREDSVREGEWSDCVEHLSVGIAGDDEDGDVDTHRTEYVGDEETGFDIVMRLVDPFDHEEAHRQDLDAAVRG